MVKEKKKKKTENRLYIKLLDQGTHGNTDGRNCGCAMSAEHLTTSSRQDI